ncbi:MAG: hypothetical protein JW860_02925 [Sedimentisphaerales bacterium]|nr:hypothetical protein [Sedimentisphaerales bacterium]
MIQLIKEHFDVVVQLCSKYHAQKMYIFGSALNEDDFNDSESDLDFLVEFFVLEPAQHAKNYFGLLQDLKDEFNRSVDLVELKSIKNPYFLKASNQHREQIYAA